MVYNQILIAQSLFYTKKRNGGHKILFKLKLITSGAGLRIARARHANSAADKIFIEEKREISLPKNTRGLLLLVSKNHTPFSRLSGTSLFFSVITNYYRVGNTFKKCDPGGSDN